MTQEEIKQQINLRVNEMLAYADNISGEFNIDVIQSFKDEFKMIRSLTSFIKVQKGDKGVKLPEKCKELYKVAGTIREIQIQVQEQKDANTLTPEEADNYEFQLRDLKNDWNRNYSQNLFLKLEKELGEFNFKSIRSEFLENFFKGSFRNARSAKNNILT